ncbi:MAG: manganese-binding transcriptional regulator MntR [bacterium]|nr:manganese-binding transcriptional regulator MntR [bacterium]
MKSQRLKTTGPRKHLRTRSDHATELAEDYVEAIAEIADHKGICRAVDLAKQFGVSHVTVNKTIGRLVRDGYVETEPYGPVTLTEKGRKLARESKARHETVYNFLIALGVSSKVALIDSEGIEHHVSQETLKAMQAFLDQQQSAH